LWVCATTTTPSTTRSSKQFKKTIISFTISTRRLGTWILRGYITKLSHIFCNPHKASNNFQRG
jgi:hypothetical protein